MSIRVRESDGPYSSDYFFGRLKKKQMAQINIIITLPRSHTSAQNGPEYDIKMLKRVMYILLYISYIWTLG